MASIQQMPRYPKSKSKSWDWDSLGLADASQKYHKVEQLDPAPTWSPSGGNHDCKKFSVIEADVENHDRLHKNLEGWKASIPTWRKTDQHSSFSISNALALKYQPPDVELCCLICADSVQPKQRAMINVSTSKLCPWPWPWHNIHDVDTSSSCGRWEPIHEVVVSHQTQDFPTET